MSQLLKSKCPYCDFRFEKKPVRTAICKNCSNRFYVKNRKPITSKEKLFFDLCLEFPNIKESDIKRLINEKRSLNDYRWSLLQQSILEEKSRNNDHLNLKYLYVRCARLMESEGRDPEPYLKLADQQVNTYYKNLGCFSGNELNDMIEEEIGYYRNKK